MKQVGHKRAALDVKCDDSYGINHRGGGSDAVDVDANNDRKDSVGDRQLSSSAIRSCINSPAKNTPPQGLHLQM